MYLFVTILKNITFVYGIHIFPNLPPHHVDEKRKLDQLLIWASGKSVSVHVSIKAINQ